MSTEADYLKDNRDSWDQRAAVHAGSTFYNVSGFKSDPEYLSDIVRFDIPRLPRLEGLHIAHLMCHIGTDTLSLARLGAASVTGLDFSSASLAEARSLASATHGSGGERLSFVEGNVYDSVTLLGAGKFDMVFTGVGVLCWLPKVREWAAVVAGLLKPGGKFFIRERHPQLWTVDEKINQENPEEQLRMVYPYFEQPRPITSDVGLTYVNDSSSQTLQTTGALQKTHEFNHGMGETLQALLDAGLRITSYIEHETLPWLDLPGRMVYAQFLQEYKLKHNPSTLPLSFTLQAVKEDYLN